MRTQRVAQLARFYDAKQARQEALELQTSILAARAATQDMLRRFYAHKAEQLHSIGQTSLPAPHANGHDRADATAALRATKRMDASSGWSPTPDGCSCPPAESWTLLDDLTQLRVWF